MLGIVDAIVSTGVVEGNAAAKRVSFSDSLHDAAAADTARADADLPDLAIDLGSNLLEIRQPPPLGPVMGMTHIVANQRSLATNFTPFCHRTLPIVFYSKKFLFCSSEKISGAILRKFS